MKWLSLTGAADHVPSTFPCAILFEKLPMTMVNDVEASIIEALSPFRRPDSLVTGDTVIMTDLDIDSVVVMDIVMELEDKFEVSVPMDQMARIKTVRELAQTIASIRSET